MSLILHVSDPHFGTERTPVVAALTHLAHTQKPDLLILSGDITQRARFRQFSAAGHFVESLGIPEMLAIPGNHDIPLFDLLTRIFMPYRGYQRVFGNNLEPVFESDDLLVIGVRTTRRYRHIQGEVSHRQLQRVADRLQRVRPQQLRIVVTHQPVYVARAEDNKNLLWRHDEAIATWTAAGADLILGGHIHLPFIAPLLDQNSGGQAWAVQAGTALSSRIRGEVGNSVNLIRYQADVPHQCLVERWDFDESAHIFALLESHELSRNISSPLHADG